VNFLLIDSTKPELIISYATNGKVVETQTCKEQRKHDQNINALAGKYLKDLSAIAVVTGPGSWTGIRVGLAVAKAYSYVLKVPIIELRDEINIDVAMKKYNEKQFLTAFSLQPFYNGDFVVKSRA